MTRSDLLYHANNFFQQSFEKYNEKAVMFSDVCYYFEDADITRVSVCVFVFFLILVAVLRWLPRCFTIGEAMVVTQSIALLSTDSFTDLGIKVLRLIKIQKAYKPLLS